MVLPPVEVHLNDAGSAITDAAGLQHVMPPPRSGECEMDSDLAGIYRAKLNHLLAMAEGHVAEGQAHIDKRRSLIEKLERDGSDIQAAQASLKQFEELQKLHLEDRDRLRKEVAQWDAFRLSDHPLVPEQPAVSLGSADPSLAPDSPAAGPYAPHDLKK
jgi:hypothetical protein